MPKPINPDKPNPTLCFSDKVLKESLQAAGLANAAFLRKAVLFYMELNDIPLLGALNTELTLPQAAKEYILANYKSEGKHKKSNGKEVRAHVLKTWGIEISVSRLGKVVERGKKV